MKRKLNDLMTVIVENETGMLTNVAYCNVAEQETEYDSATHSMYKLKYDQDVCSNSASYMYVDGDLVFQARGKVKISADRTSVPADGESIVTLTVKKYDSKDKREKKKSDNDEILISCTRGSLSTLKTNLVNGEAQFTWKAISETVPVSITVYSKVLDRNSVHIELTPVES